MELGKDDFLSWHRILATQGLVGAGLAGRIRRHRLDAPRSATSGPTNSRAPTRCRSSRSRPTWSGPCIYTFGTPEQKARFLPRIVAGDVWWCQGYSEPGAGSDLASLQTRAVRDGDHYVVNGQKTWTTLAQHADWGFFLVRTDPSARKQAGISFLLIDMKSPGVTVRPIITLDGAHEVNEVWLENVQRAGREPRARGEQGLDLRQDAAVARAQRHRAASRIPRSPWASCARWRRRSASRAAACGRPDVPAQAHRDRGRPDRARVHRAARCSPPRTRARRPASRSRCSRSAAPRSTSGINELTLEALGSHAVAACQPRHGSRVGSRRGRGATAPSASPTRTSTCARLSIFGGSNEIQRNILAKAVLGL